MLVNRSIDGNCYFLFSHSVEQNGRANWYQQRRPVRHQSRRVLNDFDVFIVVINIKSVIEFVENFDGAGIGITQCISRGRQTRSVLMIKGRNHRQSLIDCHLIYRQGIYKLPPTLRCARHYRCQISMVLGTIPLTLSWRASLCRQVTSEQHVPLHLSIFRLCTFQIYWNEINKKWKKLLLSIPRKAIFTMVIRDYKSLCSHFFFVASPHPDSKACNQKSRKKSSRTCFKQRLPTGWEIADTIDQMNNNLVLKWMTRDSNLECHVGDVWWKLFHLQSNYPEVDCQVCHKDLLRRKSFLDFVIFLI